MSDYTNDYNFKRLAKEGETSWDDVIQRFINHMLKKGCKTSREDLEWLLLNYYALPNSPALRTAGEDKFYASACSSYPITDSMDEGEFSILNTLKISSMATKAGIGTGINFSMLRSKNESVKGKHGTTGGPVSFLRAISGFTSEITQATRKSAAMGTLSVHHPDIIDFITCKQKDGNIENFNLSVLLSDEFMSAVENDTEYELTYPHTKEKIKLKAKDVFDCIALNTWNNGEPGLLFTDNIKKDYFTDIDDNHILNNPCCFAGYNQLLTKNGYNRFDELAKLESVDIVGGDGKIHKSRVWLAGIKDTIILKFENILEEECFTVTSRENFDKYIECTPEHIFEHESKETQAKDLLGLTFNLEYIQTTESDDFCIKKTIYIPYKCTSIENGRKVEVYDFEEPDTHWGYVEGFKVHNSEALLSYDDKPGEEWLEMCVLASINLPKFEELSVKDKIRAVDITVSMLNDIIDVQDYVVGFQEQGMKFINRKIGIGVAGLATVLAKKGIRYSSDEAYKLTNDYFTFIGEHSKRKSESMFTDNIDKENKVWVFSNKLSDTLPATSPLHKLKRYNASLLSVAPTSSLSNIFNDMNAEGSSYGIEPYFTTESYVVHNSYGDYVKKDKIIDYIGEEKVKSTIECANDLDYKAHLKPVEAYYAANWCQGITQACSKTINFKNNVTVDEVKEAIMYCWKNRIKGISFYRDNSRKNQVIQLGDKFKDCVELDNNNRPIDIFVHQSPKRPEFLTCDIFHTVSDKQSWLVLIGLFNDKPYEVFAGLEENITIPKKYKVGKIQKKKGYHLIVGEGEDELTIKDIPNAFKNPQFATLTRILSFSLRHGGPLKFCIEQLQKEGGFDSFGKAVGRVLKKYITENESIDKPCPNCGGSLVYISGCPTCTGDKISNKAACGYSRCS